MVVLPVLSLLLSASASAQSGQCQTRLDTWADFRPDASSHTWVDAGGWDKKRLSAFPDHRVAQAELEKSAFKRYPALIQDQLLEEQLPLDVVGLDEVALKLAWGEPDFVWGLEDRACRALLYGERTPPVVFDSCDGELIRMHTLSEPVPCARLDAVSDRLKKSSLEALDRQQAVQVLAGMPDTWMDTDALELAFGKPLEKKRNQRTYADARGIQEEVTVQVSESGFAVSWQWARGAGDGRDVRIASTHIIGEPWEAPASRAVEAPAPTGDSGSTSASTSTVASDPAPAPSSGGGASGGPSREPVPEPTRTVAVNELPSVPPADLPDARYRYRGACGQQAITARLDVAGPEYRMSVRMAGDHDGALAIYRTSGRVRGSDDALSFDGLGSGVLADDQLTLTLGPWPLASCSGSVLQPEP
jgi:hypothetical protein